MTAKTKETITLLFHVFKQGIIDVFQKEYGHRAAALSFYTIISLMPLVIIITTIISIIPFKTPELAILIHRLIPEIAIQTTHIYQDFSTIITQKQLVYAIISFAIAYYFSSRLFLTMYQTLSIAFNRKKETHQTIYIVALGIPILIIALFIIYLIGLVLMTVIKTLFMIRFIPMYFPETFLNLMMNITNWVTLFSFIFLT